MNDISLTFNIPTVIFFLITLLAIGVCFFLIGYFVGKRSGNGVYNSTINRPNSFFDNPREEKKTKVVINDTKFVTEIKTDGMEKKYENLGEIKQSTENITDSINKLKNLKR